MKRAIHRVQRRLLVGALTLFTATAASGAGVLEVTTHARIQSGTNPLDEEQLSSTLLPGLSTGERVAQTPNLSARSEAANSAVGNGITAKAAWAGSSMLLSPSQGTSNTLSAGAKLSFEDIITVSSASLPDGTPVQLQFALFGAASVAASQDIASVAADNRADASVLVTGRIGETVALGERFAFDGNNIAFATTSGPTHLGAEGLFAATSSGLQYTVNTAVGRTVELNIRPRAQATGGVPSGGTLFGIKSGAASAALAIVFGASASLSEVELLSDYYGGTFPALGLASTGAAQALLGTATVPLPAPLLLLAPALTVLLAQRRPQKRDRT